MRQRRMNQWILWGTLLLMVLATSCAGLPDVTPEPTPPETAFAEAEPSNLTEFPEPVDLPEVEEPPPPPPPPPPVELAIFHALSEVHPGDFFGIRLTHVDASDSFWTSLEPAPTFTRFDDEAVALVPVSYRISPGELSFTVKVFQGTELRFEEHVVLDVVEKEFEKQYLQVTGEQSALLTTGNWESDWQHLQRARAHSADKPLWEGPFILPVEDRISTEYGVVRFINNVESSRHSGLDVAAPLGTPVLAGHSGVVTLAMELIISGNVVIIDHGMNLFTSHLHLDQILVEEGDWVEQGDIIGEVGSTGFSTGPHLHWTVGLGHTPINPWIVLDYDPLLRGGFEPDPEDSPADMEEEHESPT